MPVYANAEQIRYEISGNKLTNAADHRVVNNIIPPLVSNKATIFIHSIRHFYVIQSVFLYVFDYGRN